MSSLNKGLLCMWVAVLALWCGNLSAYELATHARITTAAYARSILSDASFMESLGISGQDEFDRGRSEELRPIENRGTPEGWLRQGAVKEDGFGCTDTRPTNHFFDPANDRPLTVLGHRLGLRSPDWALEDSQDAEGHDFSLNDALERFREAMSLPKKEERDRSFGSLFQTLGHVMYHVQDMAQLEHVRNDAHQMTRGSHA